jgi:hypothetical protein
VCGKDRISSPDDCIVALINHFFFFSLPHKLFTRRNLFQTNRFPRWVHTHTHALLMDAGYIIDMFGRQILRGRDLFVVQINARHSLFFFSRDPPIVRTFTHTHGKNRGAGHGACPFIFLLILQLEKKGSQQQNIGSRVKAL